MEIPTTEGVQPVVEIENTACDPTDLTKDVVESPTAKLSLFLNIPETIIDGNEHATQSQEDRLDDN